MIKFETINGTLCRMVEPTPLTENTQFPCLVRMIQDETQMGKYNNDMNCWDTIKDMLWITRNIKGNPLFNKTLHAYEKDSNGQDSCIASIHQLEIIGYPVEEGSAEWALYQMMQGEKVCNPTLATEKATRFGSYEVEQFNTFWYIVGDAVVEGKSNYETLSVSSWIAASSSTGWQLYDTEQKFANVKAGDSIMCSDGRVRIVDTVGKKPDKRNGKLWFNLQVEDWGLRTFYFDGTLQVPERELRFTLEYVCEPKPEPPKEPDYVICKRCGGTGYEIKEQKPDDLYLNIKPSNPVDWCFDKKNLLVLVDDTFKGIVGENVTREQVGEIAKLLTEPEPEQPKYKVGDWVECVAKQGQTKLVDYLGGMGCYKTNYGAVISPCEILRKLSPSEVVVPITISGTVRQAYNEDGTIDDEQFQLLPNGSWDGTEMFISFDALDSHTRKLVESLLKAQEKECQ